jgi:hypothetical protein
MLYFTMKQSLNKAKEDPKLVSRDLIRQLSPALSRAIIFRCYFLNHLILFVNTTGERTCILYLWRN